MFDGCAGCILPAATPGIAFDDSGVCNYCHSYVRQDLKGESALLAILEKHRKKDSEYDCIVNISGGRDSSYTILKTAKDFGLRTLAVNYRNPFTHPIAEQNLENIEKKLRLKIHGFSFKKGFHEKLLRYNLIALIKKPDPAMVPMLCISCKLIWQNILKIASANNIRLIISGGNLYEQTDFKRILLGGSHSQSLTSYYSKYVGGLAQHALKNLRYLRLRTFIPTVKGYLYSNPYSPMVRLRGRYVTRIDLFHYLPWNEEHILRRITDELDWEYPSDSPGSWRFDCRISHLKDMLYFKILGLTEKDDFYSKLIREKLMTREKALERINRENNIDLAAIKKLMKIINLDYSLLKKFAPDNQNQLPP
jgi:hypothetical protein